MISHLVVSLFVYVDVHLHVPGLLRYPFRREQVRGTHSSVFCDV